MPGHWEGDLIIGANSASAIGTLVERTTQFTMLLHLSDDHGATAVRDAIAATIAGLPEQLRRSAARTTTPHHGYLVRTTLSAEVSPARLKTS